MKFSLRVLMGLMVVFCARGALSQELAGQWQGRLQVDGSTQLNVEFTFTKQPNGNYSAVLNSNDAGSIRNVAASSVVLQDRRLNVKVPTLSGAYAGTLSDTRIEGTWTQEGKAIPLVLTRPAKPVLSKAAVNTLLGTWHGPLALGEGRFTLVARFRLNDQGELIGTVAAPERGGGDIPLTDIDFAGERVSFKIPGLRAQYSGQYASGAFNGALKMGPAPDAPGQRLTLTKGEYVPPVRALKLAPAAFDSLAGRWEGTLNTKGPQGKEMQVQFVVRFETASGGQRVAFVDCPTQNMKGLVVSDAVLAGGKLVMKMAAIGGEYRADLSGKTLTGQWTEGAKTYPLNLVRK